MKEYHKLVRDRIPGIIKLDGKKPKTRIASSEEFGDRLLDKVTEEIGEFKASGDVEELVDILEAVEALAITKGVSQRELRKMKNAKYAARGGFAKRVILETVEENEEVEPTL